MTIQQPPTQPVGKRTCFNCDRRLPASQFAGVHLGGKLVQQCDECRAAQPDYLAELQAMTETLHAVHARLTAVMNSTERDGDGQLADEWYDCYRVSQAVHLAAQLVYVARDNEQGRRAPVPFLPVEPAAQAHLRAILDDVLGDGA